MRLDFDRDGLLETRGLPVCPVGSIEHADTGQARRSCADAMIGTGHVGAIFDFAGIAVEATRQGDRSSTARRKGGNPTVIGHAYTTIPYPRTYTVVIPIKPLSNGAFSYRATFDVPKLAGRRHPHPHRRQDRPPLRLSRAANAATSTPAARPA